MTLRRTAAASIVVLGPVAVVVVLLVCPTSAKLLVVALIGATVAVWVGLRHPLAYYWALAVALGAAPFGQLPFLPGPMILFFSVACLLAALLHPTAVGGTTPLEVVVWLLVLAGTLSVAVSGRSGEAWVQYAEWLIATLLLVALLRLDRGHLARFGRIFVWSASAAAVFALVLRFVDPQSRLMGLLAPIGYQADPDGSRFVYYADGGQTLRLAGTWVDPNAAGIFLFVALALCLLLFRRRVRWLLAALLTVALVLTLSRAAMASVVGGSLLVLVFQDLPRRYRSAICGAIGFSAVAALAVRTVRERLLTSFGSHDAGTNVRIDALRLFPEQMAGHWWFGRSWDAPELIDPALAFLDYHPANAPLLSLYRGGVLVGVAFTVLLVVGSVMGYQLMRTPSWATGALGAGFIAFSVAALQLDYPVVTIAPVTAVFSVLLAFLAAAWDERRLIEEEADEAAVARRPRADDPHATAAR